MALQLSELQTSPTAQSPACAQEAPAEPSSQNKLAAQITPAATSHWESWSQGMPALPFEQPKSATQKGSDGSVMRHLSLEPQSPFVLKAITVRR